MKKNKSSMSYNSRLSLGIVIFLSTIFIVTVLIIAFTLESNANAIETLNFTEVEVPMISSEDGSRHKITVDLSVDLSQKSAHALSSQELKKNIEKVLSDLDYSKLASRESMQYLTDELEKELSEYIVPGDSVKAYISKMTSNDVKIYEKEVSRDERKFSKVLKAFMN